MREIRYFRTIAQETALRGKIFRAKALKSFPKTLPPKHIPAFRSKTAGKCLRYNAGKKLCILPCFVYNKKDRIHSCAARRGRGFSQYGKGVLFHGDEQSEN